MAQSEDNETKHSLDNVIPFPKKVEKKVNYNSEDMDCAIDNFCILANGLKISTDLSWKEIMVAIIISCANCGIQSGMSEKEFLKFLKDLRFGDLQE